MSVYARLTFLTLVVFAGSKSGQILQILSEFPLCSLFQNELSLLSSRNSSVISLFAEDGGDSSAHNPI